MNEITFQHVTKAFGDTVVVKDMSFTIQDGERLVLLGPSGCGKSTTLRMIAGLETITSGDLIMNGVRSNDVPCGRRGVAMVFQNYAIYPHMSVKENIIYGLKVAKVPKEEIEKRLSGVMEMLELAPYADRKPRELSGGQRQRVALARAIVREAPYFLLDEPLSNLDAQLRLHARKELVRIHEVFGHTMVYVTHDQVEAMTIGQRIALMHGGNLVMLDTPRNVYNHPADVFCAKFIGSPAMNVMKAKRNGDDLVIGTGKLVLPDIWQKILREHGGGDDVIAGIRPEHLAFAPEGTENTLACRTVYSEDYGGRYGVYVTPEGSKEEIIVLTNGAAPEDGEIVHVAFDFTKFHLFDAVTEKTFGDPQEGEM